jgi:Uma2 family endonuclease
VTAPSESWRAKLRVTVEEYHRLRELGLLAPEGRVELIDGEILDMAPAGRRHSDVAKRLARTLVAAVGDRAFVRVHSPLRLGDRSEPEPDLALLEPRAHAYRDVPPSAADVLLLIEVSESTRRYDRTVKVPLYARHSVPEVWVVDLANELAHFYRRPAGDTYADISATDRLGPTPIAALPGVSVDLTDLV